MTPTTKTYTIPVPFVGYLAVVKMTLMYDCKDIYCYVPMN